MHLYARAEDKRRGARQEKREGAVAKITFIKNGRKTGQRDFIRLTDKPQKQKTEKKDRPRAGIWGGTQRTAKANEALQECGGTGGTPRREKKRSGRYTTVQRFRGGRSGLYGTFSSSQWTAPRKHVKGGIGKNLGRGRCGTSICGEVKESLRSLTHKLIDGDAEYKGAGKATK